MEIKLKHVLIVIIGLIIVLAPFAYWSFMEDYRTKSAEVVPDSRFPEVTIMDVNIVPEDIPRGGVSIVKVEVGNTTSGQLAKNIEVHLFKDFPENENTAIFVNKKVIETLRWNKEVEFDIRFTENASIGSHGFRIYLSPDYPFVGGRTGFEIDVEEGHYSEPELEKIEEQVQTKIDMLRNKYEPDGVFPWKVEENLVRVDLMNLTENGENRFKTFIQAILVREDNKWVIENILRLEDNRGVKNE